MTAIRLWRNVEIYSGEWRLCVACNRWVGHSSIATFFGLISRLGDGVFWYSLMIAIAMFGGELGRHCALRMAITGVAAAAMYRYLKRWTRRPRPFRSHSQIVTPVAPLDEFSFPSGHTLHAVSFTVVALAYFPVLAVVLIPFMVLVGMSRVVLGLHYPSDVVAASLIGFALAMVSLTV